jgi:NIMA (never in mitosis gene a)-related kinase
MGEREKAEALNEVRVMSALHHPSIVRYRESFEEDGCLHIVMDYARGGDLGSLIQARMASKPVKHFTEERITRWLLQIAQGLQHMHELGILHRDVKSSNIFLSEDLSSAQIGDFGIAKVLGDRAFANTAIGTPYYLSPEICDEKPYNEKSDIWALGCIAYEMITFKHAFES